MRSRVVGPALSHRGLFSSHPPPISFLPSVFFLLRMMRSFIVLFLGFDPVRSLVGLPWWFNTMLPAFPACTLVRNRSELRAKRLQTATRQYLARQYPSGGALSFLLLLFLLPFLPPSSSFILFFLRSSWRPPSLTPPFLLKRCRRRRPSLPRRPPRRPKSRRKQVARWAGRSTGSKQCHGRPLLRARLQPPRPPLCGRPPLRARLQQPQSPWPNWQRPNQGPICGA